MKNHMYNNVPIIYGAGGGKGAKQPTIAPNSLFSTDILFTLLALGEGPVYRINPNGPQDIQIQDSSINDLVNLDTDGSADVEKFFYVGATGTTSQKSLPYFGDEIVSPQAFASPVTLKKGNLDGVPENKVELQETSANDWDSLTFNFAIDNLVRATERGDVLPYSVSIRIEIYDFLGIELLTIEEREIEGKSDSALKISISVPIPEESISENGYRFTITKVSDDVDDSRTFDQIRLVGWDEVKNEKLAYPRTAILGLALKAVNSYQGGIPNFTSIVKGMIVKVPSNYNQPTLSSSEIDWRHIEVDDLGTRNIFYNSAFDGISAGPVADSVTSQGLLINRSGGSNHPQFEIVEVGEDDVAPYIIVRVHGTNTAGGTRFYNITTPFPVVPGVAGDRINVSADLQIINNSGANTPNVAFYGHWRNASNSTIGTPGITITPTTSMARYSGVPTTAAPANTDHLHNRGIFLSVLNGQTVDYTIKIRRVQVEFGTEETAYQETSYTTPEKGYYLQFSGADVQLDPNPQIYKGVWDGTFVYSWTQNPVWIIYDILTNSIYGLGIPEENIDKFTFYKVAMYCDACDFSTGKFIGVDGLSDGSFRNKPLGRFSSVRENQIGLPKGIPIKERRFVCDVSITEQSKGIDILNELAAAIRCVLIYTGGKISLASDMPDEYPAMIFNEKNIKKGSISVSGYKLSDVLTAVDASYIDPTNHFKREMIRVDANEVNSGAELFEIDNTLTIDLKGVTRRSQAMRSAQYLLAASRYQKRSIAFTTGTEALYLSSGDLISVSTTGSGINYGYGGRVRSNSAVNTSTNTFVFLEHFTSPPITQGVITNNTYPLALRITKTESDKTDLYIVSNSTFTTSSLETPRNQLPNSALNGAALGVLNAGGSLPTGWDIFNISTSAVEVLAVDTFEGLPRIRVRFNGTPSGAGPGINFNPVAVVPAEPNQDWVTSAWIQLAGGSTTNVTGVELRVLQTGSSQVSGQSFLATINDFLRRTRSFITSSGTTSLRPRLLVAASGAVDITLDIVAVQIERGSTPSAFQLTPTDFDNDFIALQVLRRYDPINKVFGSTITQFSSNVAPAAGDLWAFGELENPLNFYTSKAGRLFKVKEIQKNQNQEVDITAIEYIPEVYIDSDSFINYEPTPYLDVVNYLEVPPTPKLEVSTKPRRRSDGSIAIDARVSTSTPTNRFYTEFATEYEISNPQDNILISNAAVSNSLTIFLNSALGLANNQVAVLEGKNGFTTAVGRIPLLCNAISTANLGFITLTVEGLGSLIDENFDVHVLEVNDGIFPNIPKGDDAVTIPINEKSSDSGLLNFVGFADKRRLVSRTISSYDLANNTITIEDTVSGLNTLSQIIDAPPFYVSINQVLEADNYNQNSFYVEGYRGTYVKEGNLNNAPIVLDISPRQSAFVRFYVDGLLRNPNQYVLNINDGLTDSNIVYASGAQDVTYRVEVDYYLPPIIEIGDNIEDDFGNTFIVASTSYDVQTPFYNAALTANSVFIVRTLETPIQQLSGQQFINVSANPEGILANVQANTAQFNYSTVQFPGALALSNYRLYTLSVNSNFDSIVPDTDSLIRDLPLGTTVIRARNRNLLGRTSKYSQKVISVNQLPIRRVQNLQLIESLYREQTGGVAVRITVVFDHITEQEVTDYEISYKIDNVFDELGKDTSGITGFNTVKLPASGVDEQGKMRFTINSIDRGTSADINSITVKVTALNKEIRGKTVALSQAIDGKTEAPDNIFNLTGGQQGEQLTLFWTYPRVGDQLKDLDLKEVVFRRLPGIQSITLENFAVAQPLVTVSAGSARKSIPIDFYGTYTYFARTRDTSNRLSSEVVGTAITTSKPQRSSTIFAYSEDDPAEKFSEIENTNADEVNYPSFNDDVSTSNGSSTGWSAIASDDTDLLAAGNATYITQIRDIGAVATAAVSLDIEANQFLTSTFNDQYDTVLISVSDTSSEANVLVDTSFGGIGHVLGFANAAITTGRYDSNNKTWMTGTASDNVWAIWNLGQFIGDTSNSNSFALIAGLINANAIALGNTFFANGEPTGGNAFANVTSTPSNYRLVNLRQYLDVGTLTFQGDIGALQTQTFIRTSSAESVYVSEQLITKYPGTQWFAVKPQTVFTDNAGSVSASFGEPVAVLKDPLGTVVATQTSMASRPIYGRHPENGIRNLFLNSAFAGFTSGTVSGTSTGTIQGVEVRRSATVNVPALEVVAVSDETIDIRVHGTNSSGFQRFYNIAVPVGVADLPAAPGAQIRYSADLQVLEDSGTDTVTLVRFFGPWRDSDGVSLSENGFTVVPTTTMTRFSGVGSTAPSNTTQIQNRGIYISVNDGLTVDYTLRIRRLQIERGSTETAYQRTAATGFDITEAGQRSVYYLQPDGSDDWMALASAFAPAGGYTVAAAIGGAFDPIFAATSTPTARYLVDGSGNVVYRANTTSNQISGAGGSSALQRHISLTRVETAAIGEVWVTGADVAVSIAGDLIPTNKIDALFRLTSNYGSGRFYGGVLIPSAITEQERLDLQDYLLEGDKVDITKFDNFETDEGWVTYEAGARRFRYFQLRYEVLNNDPTAYDLFLDKFRYTVEKEQVVTGNTIVYSSSPTTVDFTSSNFLFRPVISYAILDQIDAETNAAIAVTTAASNQNVSFKLFASDGSGEYNANSSANVMLTIIGV
jgi:hypothetical protein